MTLDTITKHEGFYFLRPVDEQSDTWDTIGKKK